MALLNTLVVDLVTKTVTLTSTSLGNVVETITYSNPLNEVTFVGRPPITVSGIEFIDLMNQIRVFQTAILFNFNPNQNATVPFGSVNNTEVHDIGTNTWDLTCIYGAAPRRVLNYSAKGSNSTVDLLNRANTKTIEFPEWLRCFLALDLYRISVKSFLNL